MRKQNLSRGSFNGTQYDHIRQLNLQISAYMLIYVVFLSFYSYVNVGVATLIILWQKQQIPSQ